MRYILFAFICFASVSATSAEEVANLPKSASKDCLAKPFPDNLNCGPLVVPNQPAGGVVIPTIPRVGGVVNDITNLQNFDLHLQELENNKLVLPNPYEQ